MKEKHKLTLTILTIFLQMSLLAGLYLNEKHRIDLDSSFSIGQQSRSIASKKSKRISEDVQKNFSVISIVPTYRYLFSHKNLNYNFGVGAGLSIAIPYMPSENTTNTPINTQIKLEFGHQLKTIENTDIVLGLNHRCTLFGLIGGQPRGRQWYTIGIRKWI